MSLDNLDEKFTLTQNKVSHNPVIYLDYHATTPVDRRVADRIYHFMIEEFGNASSTDHEYGDRAEAAVKQAAQSVAHLVGASPREILWTSGATESINLAIQGSLPAHPANPYRIALLPLEHKAVLDTCEVLAKRGWAELIVLKVDDRGRIDLDYLDQVCAQGLSLLCVMAANNEIGNIYPLQAIAQTAQQYNVPFLCDASQAMGKIPLNFAELPGITYLALSGHKLYGPKGVGALVIRKSQYLQPLIHGGGHQKGMRSGTLNVPGIVGLGEACHLRYLEMKDDEARVAQMRDRLQALLQEQIPNLIINGDTENRLAGNLHLSIPGVLNSAIVARIRSKLAISTGSACSSGIEAPSHVLQAIGLSQAAIEGALRIGLGKFTTDIEVETAAEILTTAVHQVERMMDS